jgi:hypothetical protein
MLSLHRRRGRSLRHHPAQRRDRADLQCRLARPSLQHAARPLGPDRLSSLDPAHDRRYALDGSKLHALGGSSGQVSMLLCGRPSIGVEILALVWRYRSILTAHPVVKGDHVVQPTGVSVPQTVGHEITAGALDVFVMEARAGALDDSLMETDAEDVQRKVMAMPTASVPSDGGSQNAGKKRKADRIFIFFE